jgi:hypothetical protein
MTTVISDVFNSPLPPTLKWSAFDMPTLTLGSDRIVDETGMYSPSESELFDAVITCGGY